MKRKQRLYIALLAAGLCLAAAALALRGRGLPDGIGGMLTGVGSGLIGLSVSQLVLLRRERKNPALARQNKISRNDERNIALRNRAKALSGDVLQWTVLAAAWLAIGLDAPLWVPLLATGVFVAKSVMELCLLLHYSHHS